MEFDFYSIDLEYVENLYHTDSEVYFDPSNPNYSDKPYIGIIISNDGYKYFIPLTSAKRKHLSYKNSGINYDLIYEYKIRSKIKSTDIHKLFKPDNDGNPENDTVKKLLSLLDYRKSIPVCSGCYQRINISEHSNRDLLAKEYAFLFPKRLKIKKKANSIINKQKKTGIIQFAHCNFSLLEKICEQWAWNKLDIKAFNSEIHILENEHIDINTLVKIKNGELIPTVIKTDELGEFTYTISAQNEFGKTKSISLKIIVEKRK